MARECLRNAARHASAHNVGVYLFCQGNATVLEIHDDGTGFDPQEEIPKTVTSASGFSPTWPRARADLLLATAPGAGCAWRLEVPDP